MGGIAWTAGSKWSSQILSWVCTLIVARILGPADFGLIGMATVYLGLVTLFTQFGLSTAVITLRDLDENQVAQINTVAVLFGIAGFVLSSALSSPLAAFFKAPNLRWVIVAMSAGFVIGSFRTVPAALLQEDMQFKVLALIEACQAVIQSLTTVALALLGYRYWAIVCGTLVGTVVLAGGPLFWKAQRFARPKRQSILTAVRFGWYLLITNLGWYGYTNSDFLVAGRRLGQASLGAYTIAWTLASAPVEKITNLVTSVTPAVFSAVQTEHAALRRYLFNLTEALALVTFPATIGLALVADELIRLVLGAKWTEAILPLELLALYAALRSIVTLLPQILTAIGDARFLMWTTIVASIMLPTAFVVGSHWGTVGIAAGWVIVYPIVPFLLYRRLFRRIEMPVGTYVAALQPALKASGTMAVVVIALKWLLPPDLPLAVKLATEMTGGASVYLMMLYGSHRERILSFVRFTGFGGPEKKKAVSV